MMLRPSARETSAVIQELNYPLLLGSKFTLVKLLFKSVWWENRPWRDLPGTASLLLMGIHLQLSSDSGFLNNELCRVLFRLSIQTCVTFLQSGHTECSLVSRINLTIPEQFHRSAA
jgi:hypothetical protein